MRLDERIYPEILFMCEWVGHGLHPVHWRLAAELVQTGLDVSICTSGEEAEVGAIEKAKLSGLQVISLPELFNPRCNFAKSAHVLGRFLMNHDFDVLHCQGFRQVALARVACAISRTRPVIVCTDRNSSGWTHLAKIAKPLLVAISKSYLIALSREHYEYLSASHLLGRKVVHIPNGTDTTLFAYHSRRKERHRQSAVSLIFPASLTPLKGHSDILEVCRGLLYMGRRIRLLLAGEGPLLEKIISRATALGIHQHLEFLGRVPWSDMPRVYARADLGVFPSYSEMLPNALLEMMSTGLPVVAYSVGAVPEVIRDGESGYVLPLGDKAMIAKRLCHLIDHPHAAHLMGYAAAEKVKREYSVSAVAERTKAFYKRCLPTITREPR